jgi:serine/threonine-protein kinase
MERTSPPDAAATAFIGRYELLQFIAAGGMAEVWLGRRSGIGGFEKPVVIKRVLPAHAADPVFTRMFLDEARVAARLDHPNIVQVHDIDTHNGAPFIAMEYVRGPTLQALLLRARYSDAGPRVGIATAVRVISDIASGLQYAHDAVGPDGAPLNIVHRDVSPHNILVSTSGVAKLADFGVAKSRGQLTMTKAGAVKGKLHYMGPEQAKATGVDGRADVYSLGVCLYQAITGRLPFAGQDDERRWAQMMNGEFPRPTELAPDCPARLEELILSAMQFDRAKRLPSAQAFHDALEAFVVDAGGRPNRAEVARRVAELFPESAGLAPSAPWPAAQLPSPPAVLSSTEEDSLSGPAITAEAPAVVSSEGSLLRTLETTLPGAARVWRRVVVAAALVSVVFLGFTIAVTVWPVSRPEPLPLADEPGDSQAAEVETAEPKRSAPPKHRATGPHAAKKIDAAASRP